MPTLDGTPLITLQVLARQAVQMLSDHIATCHDCVLPVDLCQRGHELEQAVQVIAATKLNAETRTRRHR
jgi:hypothetical protein